MFPTHRRKNNTPSASSTVLLPSNEVLGLHIDDTISHNVIEDVNYDWVPSQDISTNDQSNSSIETEKNQYADGRTLDAYSAFITWACVQPSHILGSTLDIEMFDLAYDARRFGFSLLHAVCCSGNLSLVIFWFENFPDANHFAFDHEGRSALHIASMYGFSYIANHLISNCGFDPNLQCAHGKTPLVYATENFHLPVISFFLSNVPNSQNIAGKNGMTPFLMATEIGNLDIIKLFVDNEYTNLKAENCDGLNCLSLAAVNGHLKVLQYFITLPVSYAIPNVEDLTGPLGRNCLHHACAAQQYTIVNFLVQFGHVKLYETDISGKSAENMKNKLDELTDFIINRHNYKLISHWNNANDKERPKHVDHESTHRMAMYTPSTMKAAPSLQATILPSPAMSATGSTTSRSFKKDINTAYIPPANPTYLPPKSADAVSDESERLRRLSVGSSVSHEQVMNKLKQKEALPAESWIKSNDSKKTTENDAQEIISKAKVAEDGEYTMTSPSMVREVQQRAKGVTVGPVVSPAVLIQKRSNIALDEAMIKKLMNYASVGDIGELEEVLGSDPAINYDVRGIRDASNNNMTLLHVSCKAGDLATTQYLLEGVGSDVNAVDALGMTSLHHAVNGQYVLIVRYLVKYCGADIEIADNEGRTAINLVNVDESESNSDVEEILRTLNKALGKSASKRTKVTIPSFK